MAGEPKPAFYVAVFLVVAGLIAFAVYRSDLVAPRAGQNKEQANKGNAPKPDEPVKAGGGPAGSEAAENPAGATNITTVKEYGFKPAERLPPVKGTSAYKPMEDNTVRFAMNVWAGWGPIILANNGHKPGKEWTTPDGKKFKLELVLIDDPVTMRQNYASGEVHIGWATLDMIPLFLEGFVDSSGKPRDSRVMPRVYQQIDWSNGGDGIVVRENIKSVSDLRGKKMVLAQNSPSHYFALNMLVSGGVQPSEVNMVFTGDAFQAAAAFNANKDISAVVSWAPDIYNLEKVRGNRMLVTTQQANKLIADVWFARADFAKDHKDILEAIVRGTFDAMDQMKQDDARKKVADLMATFYNIPATDALGMLGDAHSTNWAENYQFFLNQNNPTNFERTWRQAYLLYRRVGSITHQPVSFDQVMDYSILEKLGREPKYSAQKDEYQTAVVLKTVSEIKGAEKEILTNTVVIRFYPNSADLFKKILRDINGKSVEQLYDVTVDSVLDAVAQLAGQFSAARIIIEGHTDASKKGIVPASLVKELSFQRANAVKQALLEKYKTLDPARFAVEGAGWDRPADPNDPENDVKNRRVEIRVFSAEAP